MLNALVKPYDELAKASEDIAAMAELAAEDPAFEVEIAPWSAGTPELPWIG